MFSSSECALPSGQITITCGGIRASACITAMWPSLVITGCHSLPFDFDAHCARLRRAVDRHRPDVPPVDVVLVRVVDHRAPVGRDVHVLDFEIARREQRGLAARRRHRIEMQPAVFLPREDQAIARAPIQLAVGHHALEGAAVSGVGLPDLLRLSGLHVGDAQRPRLVDLAARREHARARRRALANPRDASSRPATTPRCRRDRATDRCSAVPSTPA